MGAFSPKTKKREAQSPSLGDGLAFVASRDGCSRRPSGRVSGASAPALQLLYPTPAPFVNPAARGSKNTAAPARGRGSRRALRKRGGGRGQGERRRGGSKESAGEWSAGGGAGTFWTRVLRRGTKKRTHFHACAWFTGRAWRARPRWFPGRSGSCPALSGTWFRPPYQTKFCGCG